MIDRINDWTSTRVGFNNPQYTRQEAIQLIDTGRALGLDDSVTENLMKIGSRAMKPLAVTELTQQMENWVHVVSERGYPYRFDSVEHFQRFSNDLIRGLSQARLSTDAVFIQGSALRKPSAQDVDLAVFVEQDEFDAVLTSYFAKKTRTSDGTPIPVQGLRHAELVELAQRIKADEAGYNAQAKTLATAVIRGIINSKHPMSPELKTVAKTLMANYPELGIETVSLLIRGGDFDTEPAMQVTSQSARNQPPSDR